MTRKSALLAVLLLLVAAGVIAAAMAAPSIFSFAYWQKGGEGTSRSEVFRNLGLAGVALGALIVGSIRAWSAHRQANVAEQGNFTERFSRAAEQLGNPALPVRLGGIYALWRLAEDSSLRDLISVIDILCAFVRDPPQPPVGRPEPDTDDGGPAAAEDEANAINKLRPDVQTILDLIGGPVAPYRTRLPDRHRLDLSGANLRVARLEMANLTRANLMGINLSGSKLVGATLTDTNLSRADLTDADLPYASLTRTDLTDADLTGANFAKARFRKVNLQGANLTGTNLRRATFTNVDFTGANLAGATNLTQDQLNSACIRKGGDPPTLSEGLRPPPEKDDCGE